MLTAGDEIRSLLGRYCHLIDAGDFDGVGELMADAVLCTEDGTPGTKHVVANTDLTEAAGTITARSSYVVLQALPDLPLQPIIANRA